MDGLRLALLIIGVAIIAAIYWNARRKHAADIRNSDPARRIEPVFEDTDAGPDRGEQHVPEFSVEGDPATVSAGRDGEGPSGTEQAGAADPEPVPAEAHDEAERPQKVISLRIVGKAGADFSAEEVVLTLRGVGLQHGRFGIFHRLSDEDDDTPLFSVANLTEPGTFDLSELREKRFAGLSFFMLRPGPGRGVDAFDRMVETARAVAITLQGELLDGDGSTLSIQRERFMREDLIQYELRHLQL